MKILVCTKSVVEMESEVDAGVLADGRGWMAGPRMRINRFDEFALETALRIRERLPEVTIDALSVGTDTCIPVIKRALGMGADKGIYIQTPPNDFTEPARIAAWIAAWITRIPESEAYDLILTGVMSEDLMQGLVGPMTAARLGLPCLASVIELHIADDRQSAKVECEIQGDVREIWDIRLPAVLTVQSSLMAPRYPSLSNMLRASKTAIEVVDARSLPKPAPTWQVTDVMPPIRLRQGRVLQGTTQEKALALVDLLKAKGLLAKESSV